MKIVLGISSGIAAYKIPDLVQKLIENGHEVQVIMTSKSAFLVSPEELKHITKQPVLIELFDSKFSTDKILKERKVDHIEIAKTADLIVVAPATANTIANLAHGRADDFLTTTILATRAPVLICPSMNDQMWLHQAVQENIQKIQTYGYMIMKPEEGSLACGTDGIGRLPSIDNIKKAIDKILRLKTSLKGKKILVTAGGTEEPLDTVRVLTNRSSGKMGIALAEECYSRGAEVLLLRSKTAQISPYPVKQLEFRTAQDLQSLLKEYTNDYDVLIHTAAVSDFTVDTLPGKIDSGKEIRITLKPTEKIINKIKQWNENIILIGFKAISGSLDDTIEKIERLRTESQADYIIVNDISRNDIGFECDDNEVTIIDKTGKQEKINKMSKKAIARKIIDSITL